MSVEYECVRCGAPTNEPTMCIKCQRGESSFAAPTLLEDAERHATQLEKRVLDLDSRRQSLQREIEIISNIHQWLNVERHKAAALVDRIKAASSNIVLGDSKPN